MGQAMSADLQRATQCQGYLLKEGTVIDATLIAAPGLVRSWIVRLTCRNALPLHRKRDAASDDLRWRDKHATPIRYRMPGKAGGAGEPSSVTWGSPGQVCLLLTLQCRFRSPAIRAAIDRGSWTYSRIMLFTCEPPRTHGAHR